MGHSCWDLDFCQDFVHCIVYVYGSYTELHCINIPDYSHCLYIPAWAQIVQRKRDALLRKFDEF